MALEDELREAQAAAQAYRLGVVLVANSVCQGARAARDETARVEVQAVTHDQPVGVRTRAIYIYIYHVMYVVF